MNSELTEEAIEEAREALYQLEKELKDRANDTVSVGSHKQHSTTNDERRILDQMPRVARLSNRLESLGLTVEVYNIKSSLVLQFLNLVYSPSFTKCRNWTTVVCLTVVALCPVIILL